jgi:Uma2 family endonuclease
MPKLLDPPTTIVSLRDLLDGLGGVAPDRVRFHPPPGTAKEKHVIEIHDRENRLCELVDGVLVEKVMGAKESLLAIELARSIGNYLEPVELGIVLGADGMLRLMPRLVRIPDVSFISWERIGSDQFPDEPIPDLVPDLAVEVLSEGNTKREMERKLHEYFEAGVRLVWFIDPKSRTVDAYTSPSEFRRYRNGQTLDGGSVLPGFKLPLRQFFARTTRRKAK